MCDRVHELMLAAKSDGVKLGALDARGFLFAAAVAAKLELPLFMVRKLGKMPNAVSSGQYDTEYGHRDGVAIQRHAVHKGDHVILIDDLVATGGTFGAAVSCVEAMGAVVDGCVSVVELEAFEERRAKIVLPHVRRAAVFVSEASLLACGAWAAPLPLDYADDGAAFESKGALPKV